MTLEEWLGEQTKEFWRLPMHQKLAAVWQAARREARWEIEREQAHRYRPTNPSLDRISWE